MKRAMLGAFLWCTVALGWAAEPFRENSPQSYIVVEGDTLWDIAGLFLENPWDLPQVWQANPNRPDQKKIFPGDVIERVFVDGRPRLTVSSAGSASTRTANGQRVIKLSPKIRATPIEEAIPTIPLAAIDAFLSDSRILESPKVLASAPYVVSLGKGGLIGGVGDTLYARGEKLSELQKDFEVYRQGQFLKDPRTGELLGVLANSVGSLSKRDFSHEGQIATMLVTRANQELRIGDRLLPSEGRTVVSDYFPAAPENKNIRGAIIDVVSGVKNTGLYGNVLINLGTSNGLQDGDMLVVYRTKVVQDKVTGDKIALPPKRIGILMVYRTYQKISFAIVMQSSELIQIGDELRAP